MSIPLRLLLDPAYALPVKEKPKMGANLDLDDVVAGHPKAQQELDELRARVAELEAERDGWQQDFNTMQAEMIRQTDAAIARRFDDARREEALCELLGRAQTEIDLTLGFFGGCDHDVGACCCGTQRLLDEIDAALAGKQPQEGE